MTGQQHIPARPVDPGLVVRPATPADNDAIIALDLESPVFVGEVEETFDRAPDTFACERVLDDWQLLVAEMDDRLVGVMGGVVHRPTIAGRSHRLIYIHRARVHPQYHHRGVALALSARLFAWGRERGSEGPYYIVAPDNARSMEFVRQGGGRWPVDVVFLSVDPSRATGAPAEPLPEGLFADAVALINRTHADHDFFEQLTVASFARRLGRDAGYGRTHLRAVTDAEGRLVAVAGLWDKGATTERIHLDRTTGETGRSRGVVVPDWGYAHGREDAFAALLGGLAAEARALGRQRLVLCEPVAGMLGDPGLPATRSSAGLFTPGLEPPEREVIRGIFVDLLVP
jgi:GNAT superfamily N-acetyltransferase